MMGALEPKGVTFTSEELAAIAAPDDEWVCHRCAALQTDNAAMREALKRISASAGRCDKYIGGSDDEDASRCNRPAVYYEKGHGAFGEMNVCCDLPEHVESHRYEIEKAKSKGSHRGTQWKIELSGEVVIARTVLKTILGDG